MATKTDYVLKAGNPGGHTCHWPGCQREVRPAFWGCRAHWFALPSHLRSRIWDAYRPGQEIDKRPSEAYLAAAREVQEWIATREVVKPQKDLF